MAGKSRSFANLEILRVFSNFSILNSDHFNLPGSAGCAKITGPVEF